MPWANRPLQTCVHLAQLRPSRCSRVASRRHPAEVDRPLGGSSPPEWDGAIVEGMEHLSTQDVIDAGLADWRKLAQRLHARFRVADAGGRGRLRRGCRARGIRGLPRPAPRGDPHPRPRRPQGRDPPRPRGHLGHGRRRGARPPRQRGGAAAPAHRGPGRGHPGRAGPRHRPPGPARPVLGGGAHREHRRVGPRHGLRPHRPAAVDVVPGHRASTRCPVSAGTRTCGSRRRSPRRGSPRRSPAGGTVVDDSEAPSFTVLADPDGNKVCVCTFLDRAGDATVATSPQRVMTVGSGAKPLKPTVE